MRREVVPLLVAATAHQLLAGSHVPVQSAQPTDGVLAQELPIVAFDEAREEGPEADQYHILCDFIEALGLVPLGFPEGLLQLEVDLAGEAIEVREGCTHLLGRVL
jgi:hypothetical protein